VGGGQGVTLLKQVFLRCVNTVPVLSLLWDPLWGAAERADLRHVPATGNESAFSLPGSQ